VRYEAQGEVLHHAVCHCSDCRKSSGAPMVGWIAYKADGFKVTRGEAKEHASSEHARRYFCAECGTGLYYTNQAFLPGIVDVQSATLDDPDAVPPGAQIQWAEHLRWTETLDQLPKFERFPG
jgi:hypothetical protein